MSFFLRCLLNLVTTLLLFYIFGHEACGIADPQLGTESASSAVEGEVLTTGPSGSPKVDLFEEGPQHESGA